jgi:Flp pilus assembly protein TadD
MRSRRSLLLHALVSSALIGLPAVAGAGTSLQVPVGARGIAMGGAFSAIADDATATFWNVAGLPWIGHQEITATHADLYGSGLKDNFASFVLPLTRTQAASVDWYQSGLDDGELEFGESRIGLGYGRKITSFLSAGVAAKYLTRHTDLDGSSVRRGSGFGLDLGVLIRPIESLRIAGVAQDVFNTKVAYSEGEGTVVAYPRTTKIGAAFTPKPWGTLAVDVDDRLHVGAEYRPLESLALRSGFQTDLDGPDGTTLTFGAGLRWSIFRFDYALVDHPVLAATSHFGLSLGFNFNPSQIRIEKVETRDIYASLYRTYARQPFGTVRVKNLENTPVTARLRVFVPELMREPSEEEIVVRPRATQDIPLTAVFPDRIVDRSGDRSVQVQVSTTYQSLRLPRTEKATSRCVAYGPGAIDWSQGVAQAAAFVTTRDPVVESLAREAVRAVDPSKATSGNRNLDFTAAIFDAVAALGVAYVPDPNNPYSTISGMPKAVDTILYPRETLSKRTGDCDDTTVLLAALLGNVGIRTRFVDVPGHIFLLVNADVHERNRFALGLDESRTVIEDDEVWIPIETTALSKGFVEAWRIGAESYASWASRGRVELVDVGGAQSRYEPGEPTGPVSLPALDAPALQAKLALHLGEIATERQAFLARRYGGEREGLESTPEALNEIAYVYYSAGRLDEAKAALERALAREPESARTRNNLGAVLAAQGALDRAMEEFQAAVRADGGDAGLWLNLGLAHYAAGDSAGAEEPIARGLDLSGGYAQACGLLGLAPDQEATREGAKRMTAEEARDLLKAALRRVPRPAPSAAAAPATPSTAAVKRTVPPKRWSGRIAGGRSTDRTEIADLLYWKR